MIDFKLIIILLFICSFKQSTFSNLNNRIPANFEDVKNYPAAKNLLELCSQSPFYITKMVLDEENQLRLNFQADDLLSPYFPFIQSAIHELTQFLTLFPCETCQVKLSEKDIYTILDKIYYQRNVTEIQGYKNLSQFVATNNDLIKKYINQEAKNYENEILNESRIDADHFDQKKSRERARRKYKGDPETILIGLEETLQTFEKRHLPILMELVTADKTDWKRSVIVTQIKKEEDHFQLDFIDAFADKTLSVTYNKIDKSFELPQYGKFLLYPILVPLNLRKQWQKNINNSRAVYCADIFQLSGKAKRLEKIWGVADESLLKKITFFAPRLISGVISPIISGRSAQKISNLALGSYYLGEGRTDEGVARLADSPLNPISVANSVVGDVVSIIKSPLYATSKRSNRIQLCTMNLAAATGGTSILNYVTPVEHILSVIDEIHFTTEPRYDYFRISEDYRRNGAQCRSLPIVSHEPESVVIERLECINKYMHNKVKYEFIRYNCGAYTKEIMRSAGLGFPPLINLGIGNELGFALDKDRLKMVKDGEFICSEHIQNFRVLIAALESDIPLNETFKASMNEIIIKEKLSFSSDAIIQLIASAARSTIPESKIFAIKLIDKSYDAPLEILDPITYALRFNFPHYPKIPRDLSASASYYELKVVKFKTSKTPTEFKRGVLKKEYIPLLKNIFGDLDRPSLDWMQLYYPHAAKLYNDINEQ